MKAQRTSIGPRDAVGALFTGLSLSLREPDVRKRIGVGLLLNSVVFSLLLWGLISGAFWLVDELVSLAPTGDGFWEQLLGGTLTSVGWLLRVASVIGSLFAAPVLFNLGASLMMPIFYGRIFSIARSVSGDGEASGFDAAAIARIVAVELRRIARFLTFSALALTLNLIPVVGSAVYLVVQFLLASSAMGWDLLSHHFELHDLDYGQQKAWIKQNRALVLTLGAGATALCAIPVLQLLFITTNVAGAGVLSARLDGITRDPVD
jgi:uncharacterized protein involved in cysteine biosynthesis